MPSNPLEKQFAMLGTTDKAQIGDVAKAYRWPEARVEGWVKG